MRHVKQGKFISVFLSVMLISSCIGIMPAVAQIPFDDEYQREHVEYLPDGTKLWRN
jgi:hypothetical protein